MPAPVSSEDEVAAALAGIATYLSTIGAKAEEGHGPTALWSFAGRLEAQGLPVTRQRLLRGWRG